MSWVWNKLVNNAIGTPTSFGRMSSVVVGLVYEHLDVAHGAWFDSAARRSRLHDSLYCFFVHMMILNVFKSIYFTVQPILIAPPPPATFIRDTYTSPSPKFLSGPIYHILPILRIPTTYHPPHISLLRNLLCKRTFPFCVQKRG